MFFALLSMGSRAVYGSFMKLCRRQA